MLSVARLITTPARVWPRNPSLEAKSCMFSKKSGNPVYKDFQPKALACVLAGVNF